MLYHQASVKRLQTNRDVWTAYLFRMIDWNVSLKSSPNTDDLSLNLRLTRKPCDLKTYLRILVGAASRRSIAKIRIFKILSNTFLQIPSYSYSFSDAPCHLHHHQLWLMAAKSSINTYRVSKLNSIWINFLANLHLQSNQPKHQPKLSAQESA